MPQLKSFKTSLLFFKPIEVNLFAYIHQIQITPVDLVSLSLTIKAPGQELTNNHFKLFLTPFRRLQQLELIIETYLDHEFFNANHWEKIIVEHLPKLITFNFEFPARYESDQSEYPYRYYHVKELIFDDPYMYDNIVDISKVESLIINTSDWPLDKIVILIKTEMPCVNYLRLNCTQANLQDKYFPDISLSQIRRLSLPQFGRHEEKIQFNWSKVFPCVERLTASINSKKQIVFLIDHFKNMINGFFVLDEYHFDKYDKIKITRQWLKKHNCRLKSKKGNDFICEINDKYSFSLCLWISENDEINK
ncbi:unnamed protein product [Rotaria sp. Silwood2]|nr:unnamed protein product [Rotaria sp. Silwood2]